MPTEVREEVKEVGIKETTELINAMNDLAKEVEENTADDGKLDLIEIGGSVPEALAVIHEAKDFKEIKKEVQDLDEAESLLLSQDTIPLIFRMAGIIKNLLGK